MRVARRFLGYGQDFFYGTITSTYGSDSDVAFGHFRVTYEDDDVEDYVEAEIVKMVQDYDEALAARRHRHQRDEVTGSCPHCRKSVCTAPCVAKQQAGILPMRTTGKQRTAPPHPAAAAAAAAASRVVVDSPFPFNQEPEALAAFFDASSVAWHRDVRRLSNGQCSLGGAEQKALGENSLAVSSSSSGGGSSGSGSGGGSSSSCPECSLSRPDFLSPRMFAAHKERCTGPDNADLWGIQLEKAARRSHRLDAERAELETICKRQGFPLPDARLTELMVARMLGLVSTDGKYVRLWEMHTFFLTVETRYWY